MKLRLRMTAFSALVLGVFLVAGCSSTNEDEIAKAGSATATGNAPQYKNYADFAKAQADASKKQGDDAKAKGGAARKTK